MSKEEIKKLASQIVGFGNQGLTFCRPKMKGKGKKTRTSMAYCDCGYKMRGEGHFEGKHHKDWERSRND